MMHRLVIALASFSTVALTAGASQAERSGTVHERPALGDARVTPMNGGELRRRALKGHVEDDSGIVRLVAEDMSSLGLAPGDEVEIRSDTGKAARFRCQPYERRSHGRPATPGGVFMIQRARARLGIRLGDPVWVVAVR